MGVNSVNSVLVRSQNEEMEKVKKKKPTQPSAHKGTESFQLLKVKVDWRGGMTK